MKTMRGLFAVLLGLLFVIAVAVAMNALADHDNVIGTIEAMLGLIAMVVVVGAGYVGSIIEEHFTRIWPPIQQQAVQPIAQQQAQGPQ